MGEVSGGWGWRGVAQMLGRATSAHSLRAPAPPPRSGASSRLNGRTAESSCCRSAPLRLALRLLHPLHILLVSSGVTDP